MIEKIILDYLAETLSVPVYMMRPETVPSEYVVIEKTGSAKQEYIPSSVFAFQSYAPTLLDAAQLNEAVKEAVEGAISLPEITKVTLNSDYNFTDPTAKQPRYQAIYEVVYF